MRLRVSFSIRNDEEAFTQNDRVCEVIQVIDELAANDLNRIPAPRTMDGIEYINFEKRLERQKHFIRMLSDQFAFALINAIEKETISGYHDGGGAATKDHREINSESGGL